MQLAFYAGFTAIDKHTEQVIESGLCSYPVSTRELAQRICAVEHERCVYWDERCGGNAFEHRYEVVSRPLEADTYRDDEYTMTWFAQRKTAP